MTQPDKKMCKMCEVVFARGKQCDSVWTRQLYCQKKCADRAYRVTRIKRKI